MGSLSKPVFLLGLFLCSVALVLPSVARAEGTGVDYGALLNPPPLSAKEAKLLASEEAKYQEWLASQTGSISIEAVDTPYYYLWTPSHKQANGYYCGPATCQIIDDYWGNYVSQATYASKYNMCTTSAGTNYYVMDDVLRYYTGKNYNYYSGISTEGDFYNRIEYHLYSKHYPGSVLVHIDPGTHPGWAPYVLEHVGHIVCTEAFDWRVNAEGYRTIRINDPYNEADYHPGGGSTYGHHTYHRGIIWDGVNETSVKAMIY